MRKYIQTRIGIEVTVHDRKTISSKMRPSTILPDDMLIGRDMICGEERSWRDFVHWKEAALAGPGYGVILGGKWSKCQNGKVRRPQGLKGPETALKLP
jgi:hypothetical protein